MEEKYKKTRQSSLKVYIAMSMVELMNEIIAKKENTKTLLEKLPGRLINELTTEMINVSKQMMTIVNRTDLTSDQRADLFMEMIAANKNDHS